MEVIGLDLVEFEGLFPAVALDPRHLPVNDLAPPAKVVNLTRHLLLPSPAGMRRERQIGIGLGRSSAALPERHFRLDLLDKDVASGTRVRGGVTNAGLPAAVVNWT